MKPTRSITAAVAAIALALPTAAFAQSPSDQQYQDPFGSQGSGGGGGSSGGGSSGGGSSGGGGGSSQSGSSSGSSSSGSSSSGSGSDASQFSNSPSSSTASSSTSGPQLAATGQDTGLVALAGLGLLLMGAGLRFRLSEAPRRSE